MDHDIDMDKRNDEETSSLTLQSQRVTNVVAIKKRCPWREILVTWKQPTTTPQSYQLKFYEVNEEKTNKQPIQIITALEPTQLSQRFVELKSSTTYICEVIPRYDGKPKTGSFSNLEVTDERVASATETLKDFGKPDCIMHLEKWGHNNVMIIELSWSKINIGENYKITGYHVDVSHRRDIYFTNEDFHAKLSPIITNVDMANLKRGQKYDVKFTTIYIDLDDRLQKIKRIKNHSFCTSGDESVTNVVSIKGRCPWREILVTWKQPVTPPQSYQLQFYEVNEEKHSKQLVESITALEPTQLSQRFLELKSSTTYTCEVIPRYDSEPKVGMFSNLEVTDERVASATETLKDFGKSERIIHMEKWDDNNALIIELSWSKIIIGENYKITGYHIHVSHRSYKYVNVIDFNTKLKPITSYVDIANLKRGKKYDVKFTTVYIDLDDRLQRIKRTKTHSFCTSGDESVTNVVAIKDRCTWREILVTWKQPVTPPQCYQLKCYEVNEEKKSKQLVESVTSLEPNQLSRRFVELKSSTTYICEVIPRYDDEPKVGSFSNLEVTDERVASAIETFEDFGQPERIMHKEKVGHNNALIIELSWSKINIGENYKITGYCVNVSHCSSEFDNVVDLNEDMKSTTTNLDIANLKRGQKYNVEFATLYTDFDDHLERIKIKKNYFFFTTDGESVTNVVAIKSRCLRREILVTWKQPTTTPQGYQLKFHEVNKEKNTEQLVESITALEPTQLSQRFVELKSSTTYICEVIPIYDGEPKVGSFSNLEVTDERVASATETLKDFGKPERIMHLEKWGHNNALIIELSWGKINIGENYKITDYHVDVSHRRLKYVNVGDSNAKCQPINTDVDVSYSSVFYTCEIFHANLPPITTNVDVVDLKRGQQYEVKFTTKYKDLDDRLQRIIKTIKTYSFYTSDDKSVTNVVAIKGRCTWREILVSWKQPVTPPQSYQLQFYDVNEDKNSKQLVENITALEPTQLSQRFVELKSSTTYICEVIPRYDGEPTVGSFSNLERTDERVASATEILKDFGKPERIMHLEKCGHNNALIIELSWSKVNIGENYKITGYRLNVSHRRFKYVNVVHFNEKLKPITTHFDVADLERGQKYDIKFTTVYIDLDDRLQKIKNIKTHSFYTTGDESVTNVVAIKGSCPWREILVTWSQPTTTTPQDYQLKFYEVNEEKNSKQLVEIITALERPQLSHRFVELKSSTTYICEVIPRYDDEPKVGSFSNLEVTDERVASATETLKDFGQPEHIMHTEKRSDNDDLIVNLSWSKINMGENYKITDYHVDVSHRRFNHVNVDDFNEIFQPIITHVEVDNLQKGQKYDVKFTTEYIDLDDRLQKIKRIKTHSFCTRTLAEGNIIIQHHHYHGDLHLNNQVYLGDGDIVQGSKTEVKDSIIESVIVHSGESGSPTQQHPEELSGDITQAALEWIDEEKMPTQGNENANDTSAGNHICLKQIVGNPDPATSDTAPGARRKTKPPSGESDSPTQQHPEEMLEGIAQAALKWIGEEKIPTHGFENTDDTAAGNQTRLKQIVGNPDLGTGDTAPGARRKTKQNREWTPIEEWTTFSIKYNRESCYRKGSKVFNAIRESGRVKEEIIVKFVPDFNTVNIREIESLWVTIGHENVVKYLQSGYCKFEKEKSIFIAMEKCEKDTLYEKIEAGNLSYAVRKSTVYCIAKGLQHLKEKGIVHRDLKPQNILYRVDVPVISDFGLSKRISPDKSNTQQSGANVGTNGWRAPETSIEKGMCTFAGDIYSAGLVNFYALTNGKHPFGKDRDGRQYLINNYPDNRYQTRGMERNLEALKKIGVLDWTIAIDMIDLMLNTDPKHRPTVEAVLENPLFWTVKKRLNFLTDTHKCIEHVKSSQSEITIISELNEREGKYGNQIKNEMEKWEDQSGVKGKQNWKEKLSFTVDEIQMIQDNFVQQNVLDVRVDKDAMTHQARKCKDSVTELLRFIRNRYTHMKEDIKERTINQSEEQFLKYFFDRFSHLFVYVYCKIKDNYYDKSKIENCCKGILAEYFPLLQPKIIRNKVNNDSLEIEWETVTCANHYKLEIYTNNSDQKQPVFKNDVGKQTEWAQAFDDKFGYGISYYAVVTAIGDGNKRSSTCTDQKQIGK